VAGGGGGLGGLAFTAEGGELPKKGTDRLELEERVCLRQQQMRTHVCVCVCMCMCMCMCTCVCVCVIMCMCVRS